MAIAAKATAGAIQYATEENGRGVFTTLLVDALNGSAAKLTGDITPRSVYAHIDQSLGSWEQRPVFKTNVKQFVLLRTVSPPMPPSHLRRITEFFPSPGFEFALNPTYKPEIKGRDPGMPLPDPENTSWARVPDYAAPWTDDFDLRCWWRPESGMFSGVPQQFGFRSQSIA